MLESRKCGRFDGENQKRLTIITMLRSAYGLKYSLNGKKSLANRIACRPSQQARANVMFATQYLLVLYRTIIRVQCFFGL